MATVLVTPATAAVAAPAHPPAPSRFQLIPAFDNDRPTGSAKLSPAAGVAASPGTVVPNAEWVCTVYASDPWLENAQIHGEGNQFCSGVGWENTAIRITIQRYAGLGIWNNRYQFTSPWEGVPDGDWIDYIVWWGCSGSGTQTYRIVTDGWAVSGFYSQSVQSLNYLRVAC